MNWEICRTDPRAWGIDWRWAPLDLRICWSTPLKGTQIGCHSSWPWRSSNLWPSCWTSGNVNRNSTRPSATLCVAYRENSLCDHWPTAIAICCARIMSLLWWVCLGTWNVIVKYGQQCCPKFLLHIYLCLFFQSIETLFKKLVITMMILTCDSFPLFFLNFVLHSLNCTLDTWFLFL